MIQPKRALKTKQPLNKTETSGYDADLRYIKESVMELKSSITEMNDTLKNVNDAVLGNKYGQVGLIKKVDNHEDYIQKDKSFKSKLIGGGLVIGVMWTVVLKFIEKIFN